MDLGWLRPDGKTQMAIEYVLHADVFISAQHAGPLQAAHSTAVADDSGADATAPSMRTVDGQGAVRNLGAEPETLAGLSESREELQDRASQHEAPTAATGAMSFRRLTRRRHVQGSTLPR